MIGLLQRVKYSSVTIDDKLYSEIGAGILILFGVEKGDEKEKADKIADKISKLRIFEDENGKTNRSLADVEGELLIISQFTLYADCRHGNRPSFTGAGAPQEANRLYEYFVKYCRERVAKVETGEFGADMKVSLVNDGPFTIVLDESIQK